MADRFYYDVDHILATETKVPFEFGNEAKNLGYLDPSSSNRDLKEGAKVELPLWLAELLHKRGYGTAHYPVEYNKKSREKLQAGSTIAKLSPFYYIAGLRLAAAKQDRELLSLLRTVFADRYKDVFDKSFNLRNTDVTAETDKLSLSELRLFEIGTTTSIELEQWRSRKTHTISPPATLQMYKRRKADSAPLASVAAAAGSAASPSPSATTTVPSTK